MIIQKYTSFFGVFFLQDCKRRPIARLLWQEVTKNLGMVWGMVGLRAGLHHFPLRRCRPGPTLGARAPLPHLSPVAYMCIHPPAHWSATILQFYTIKRHHIHSSVTAWDSRTFLQFGQSQIFGCAKAGMRSLAITQCTWAYSAFLMGSYTPRYCSQP